MYFAALSFFFSFLDLSLTAAPRRRLRLGWEAKKSKLLVWVREDSLSPSWLLLWIATEKNGT